MTHGHEQMADDGGSLAHFPLFGVQRKSTMRTVRDVTILLILGIIIFLVLWQMGIILPDYFWTSDPYEDPRVGRMLAKKYGHKDWKAGDRACMTQEGVKQLFTKLLGAGTEDCHPIWSKKEKKLIANPACKAGAGALQCGDPSNPTAANQAACKAKCKAACASQKGSYTQDWGANVVDASAATRCSNGCGVASGKAWMKQPDVSMANIKSLPISAAYLATYQRCTADAAADMSSGILQDAGAASLVCENAARAAVHNATRSNLAATPAGSGPSGSMYVKDAYAQWKTKRADLINNNGIITCDHPTKLT